MQVPVEYRIKSGYKRTLSDRVQMVKYKFNQDELNSLIKEQRDKNRLYKVNLNFINLECKPYYFIYNNKVYRDTPELIIENIEINETACKSISKSKIKFRSIKQLVPSYLKLKESVVELTDFKYYQDSYLNPSSIEVIDNEFTSFSLTINDSTRKNIELDLDGSYIGSLNKIHKYKLSSRILDKVLEFIFTFQKDEYIILLEHLNLEDLIAINKVFYNKELKIIDKRLDPSKYKPSTPYYFISRSYIIEKLYIDKMYHYITINTKAQETQIVLYTSFSYQTKECTRHYYSNKDSKPVSNIEELFAF